MIITQSAPVIVKFQIEDYTDALHFVDQVDRDQYTDEQIEVMCQARYDNWKAVTTAVRPEPTPEEITLQVESMIEQQRITQDQLISLAPAEVLLPILEGQAAVISKQIETATSQQG